jgi:hypothetical protein
MSRQAVRLTVNDVEVRVPPWARWRDAVTAYLPEAGASLSTGTGFLADESGEPIDADGHVVPGAHIRFHDTVEGDDE